MNSSVPILGTAYDRRQIREIIGGGDLVSYLPSKKSIILAGCFDPTYNKRAPLEIDVGPASIVVAKAVALGRSQNEIPIFLKKGNRQWEFVGNYRCLRFSQSATDIRAYSERRKNAVGVLYFEKSAGKMAETIPVPELLDFKAKEGRARFVTHLKRERSRDLITLKRKESRLKHGCLVCEGCGLKEDALPAHIGEACFETHHNVPLSQVVEQTVTRLADVALLCANCHRMIHKNDPMIAVQEFRKRLT